MTVNRASDSALLVQTTTRNPLTFYIRTTPRNHQFQLPCFVTQGFQFDFRVPWSAEAIRLTITNATGKLPIRSTGTEAICTAQVFYIHVFAKRQTQATPTFQDSASPAYPINTVQDPCDIVAARAHAVKAPRSPRDDVRNLHLFCLHELFAQMSALLW